MHYLSCALLAAAAATSAHARGFSGRALVELQQHAAGSTRSTELLGDLAAADPSSLTPSGATISAVLTGSKAATAPPPGAPGAPPPYAPPGPLGSPACRSDDCCVWSQVAPVLRAAFASPTGCTALARSAIRLGFHDAAAWNTSVGFGGADGSVVLSDDEGARFENLALRGIINQTQAWYDRFKAFDLGMADLIQMSAITAIAACPGGPRIKAFVGRRDSDQTPPEGLIPSPFAGAEANIALFAAKTFSAADLVALVGAHTVSTQNDVDPAKAGASQDTTPGAWDSTFYAQTASPATPAGVFKFPSDLSLANSSATSGTWNAFAANQGAWNAVSSNSSTAGLATSHPPPPNTPGPFLHHWPMMAADDACGFRRLLQHTSG